MYTALLKSHSGMRWLLLIAIIASVIISLLAWRNKRPYIKQHHLLYKGTVILFHVQLVLGFVLYFLSPKVLFSPSMFKTQLFRYFTIEHSFMMLISVTLITVGFSLSKRISSPIELHKKIFYFFIGSLLILLLGIPWPFLPYGGQWM
ncbi:MAG: hypothetical protein JEZ03_09560 [Bacteroidales bacterium]|nr:hypothetical protein [Bacteroidales bacterium]